MNVYRAFCIFVPSLLMKMKRVLPVFISLLGICILMTLTRPSLDSFITIFLFFALLYALLFFGAQLILLFLKFHRNARIAAALFAGFCTGIQVLLTFKALRILDLMLIGAVVGLVTWYVAKVRD